MQLPPPFPADFLYRHSYNHNHDFVKVLTLYLQIFGNFVFNLVVVADSNREEVAQASIIIFTITSVSILVVNAVLVFYDSLTNQRPISENKQPWLITTSKTLIVLGAFCYYIGDNLPTILREFAFELDCGPGCVNRGQIAGVFFLFVSLTTFTFIPNIFRKLNRSINHEYDTFYILEERNH